MNSELSPDAKRLLDKYQPEMQKPGDITIGDAERKWKVGREVALSILEEMVANGDVVRLEGVVLKSKRRGVVFRPVDKEQ